MCLLEVKGSEDETDCTREDCWIPYRCLDNIVWVRGCENEMCCGKEKEVLILCCSRCCRTVVWSVVGRDVAVRDVRVRVWLVFGIPE